MRLADLAVALAVAVAVAVELGQQVELLASGPNAPAMSPRIDRTRTLALQIHLLKRKRMPKASSLPRLVPRTPRRRKTLEHSLLEPSPLEPSPLEPSPLERKTQVQPRPQRAIEHRADSSVSAAHGLSPTASTACS